MTGRRTISDDAIATMLRARADHPVPTMLARGIADAVVVERAERGAGRTSSRSHGRSWPLLLVAAALLLAVGGSALVLSRPADRDVAPTPGPSGAVLAPSPSGDVDAERCSVLAIEEAGLLGEGGTVDPSAIIGTASTPPGNGAILAMVQRTEGTGTMPVDLWRIAPAEAGRSDETHIAGSYLWRGATKSLVPSPNGVAVAVALDPYDGPVLTHPDCADVVLITTADGRSAGRIFGAEVGERYTAPTWSIDGSRLYAIRSNSQPCTEIPGSASRTSYDCTTPLASSLVAWDVATDAVIDLGRPCETCMIEGELFLSPDGKRLVAAYRDGAEHRQLAILDRPGGWSLVPADPDQAWGELDGWIDDSRLQIAGLQGRIHFVQADAGTAETSSCGVGTGLTLWCDRLAPDRTRSAYVGRMGGIHGAIVMDVSTGELTRIPVPDPSGRYQTTMTGLLWSPDSRWLALQVIDGETDDHSLYVVPADRSAEPRVVLEGAGPLEAWAWLPAPAE